MHHTLTCGIRWGDTCDCGELARQNDLMDRIKAWQAAGFVHPLTCGNDSDHRPLEPRISEGYALLECKDCGYVQTMITDLPSRV